MKIKVSTTQSSKYKFEDFTNGMGFRIFRLNQHIITVFYKDGGFNIKQCYSKCNLFSFHRIIHDIAYHIASKIRKGNRPYSWMANKIGKSLAKKISQRLRSIINKVPKDIVDVNRRFFNINFKNAKPYTGNLTKYDISQIKKYRAAAYAYSNIYGVKDKNFKWRKSFGNLDKIQKEILHNIPGNISLSMVSDKLSIRKFDRVITNRTELLIKLLTNHDLILKTPVKEFKRCMKIYDESLSIRKTKDVSSFIINIECSHHKVNSLIDLVILEKEKNDFWEHKMEKI